MYKKQQEAAAAAPAENEKDDKGETVVDGEASDS
jgi:hypothetical protein